MLTAQELRKSLAPYVPYPLQDLLTRAAGSYGGKVAVIDGDRRFTYGQLSEYSNRFASALAKLGVRKGDRIAILAHADRPGAQPFIAPLCSHGQCWRPCRA